MDPFLEANPGNDVSNDLNTAVGDALSSADSLFGPATEPIGLPADTQSTSPPPGFETTTAAIQPAPPISTVDKIWNSIKQDSQSALSWTEGAVKSTYETGKSAVSTVAGDIAHPVENAAQGIFWYAMIGVVIIAGAIYFIGKGGAVKLNAVV